MKSGQELHPASVASGLPADYETIALELREVENLMLRELESENGFVNEVIRYGFRLGGKRLRPALVLLVGKTLGLLNSNHHRTAAVLEMIHTATLIHDDILDGAKIRRHLETMNIRWNSAISVLAGDVLFTRAVRLTTVSDDLFEYRTVVNATQTTCEAELKQVASKGNYKLTQDKYYELITGKTAALLSCACLLGAYFSGADQSTQEVFRLFGEKLGIAFQMIDDILDLVGEESVAGKTLGTDIFEGKSTLPLILFMQTASKKDQTEMLALLQQEEKTETTLKEIVKRLSENGSIDAARRIAAETIQSAIDLLDFPDAKIANSASLDALKNIARYVIERKM